MTLFCERVSDKNQTSNLMNILISMSLTNQNFPFEIKKEKVMYGKRSFLITISFQPNF